MALEVDSGMLAYMRKSTGAIQIELRQASGTDPFGALGQAREAIFDIPHPDELDRPCASFASPVVLGPRGPTFWFDVADAEAYDGLLEGLLYTIVTVLASAVEDGLVTWPEGVGEVTLTRREVRSLLSAWKRLQAKGEAPPRVVSATPFGDVFGAGWSRRAAVPTSRSHLGACAGPDGFIYGVGGGVGRPLKTVEAYDPSGDTWHTVAPLGVARWGPGVTRGPGGLIYAVGGFGSDMVGHASAEAYDVGAERWQPVAPLSSQALTGISVTTGSDGRVYSIAISPNVLEVYDTSTDRWSPLSPPPAFYEYITAVAARDGRIYAFGGQSRVVEAYDPERDSWSQVSSPHYRIGLGFRAALGGDGRIYGMGAGTGTPTAAVEVYEVAFDRWIQGEPMPGPRAGMALATGPDGAIYVIGGYRHDGYGQPVYYGPTDVFAPTLPEVPPPPKQTPTSAWARLRKRRL